MKARALMIGCVLAVLLAVAAYGAKPAQTSGGESSEIRDLKREVAVLRKRIDELEKRGGGAAALKSFLVRPGLPALPKGSIRREINGMTYYIVLLSQDPARTP